MANKKDKNKVTRLNHRIFFGLLLFCIAWLIYSACYMAINGGMTYEAVTQTLIEIVPYCLIIGLLGYGVGYILDKPSKSRAEQESKEMLDKFLKDAANQAAQAAQNARMAAPNAIAEDMPLKVDLENDKK